MLTKLVPDIKRTAELVEEITAACREQDVGADQINQAIQQLDKVTQQNAAASEEMSATSEELAAQAEQLQATIAYFRLDAPDARAKAAVPVHPQQRHPVVVRPRTAGGKVRPRHPPRPRPRFVRLRPGRNGKGVKLDLSPGERPGHPGRRVRAFLNYARAGRGEEAVAARQGRTGDKHEPACAIS